MAILELFRAIFTSLSRIHLDRAKSHQKIEQMFAIEKAGRFPDIFPRKNFPIFFGKNFKKISEKSFDYR